MSLLFNSLKEKKNEIEIVITVRNDLTNKIVVDNKYNLINHSLLMLSMIQELD